MSQRDSRHEAQRRLIVDACAEAAHEMNRIYSRAIGDSSHVPWDQAPEWQRTSSAHGIEKALAGAKPIELHESWLREKEAAGWVFGPVKDPEKKTHPCMVPYAELPVEQRAKDVLYSAVVNAMEVALDSATRTHCPCGTKLSEASRQAMLSYCDECLEAADGDGS